MQKRTRILALALVLAFALAISAARAVAPLAVVIPITAAASHQAAVAALAPSLGGLATMFGAAAAWLGLQQIEKQGPSPEEAILALTGPKIVVQTDPVLAPPAPAGWTWQPAAGQPGYRLLPPDTLTPQTTGSGSIVVVYTNGANNSKRISPEFATIDEAGAWYSEVNNCYFSGTTYCDNGSYANTFFQNNDWTAIAQKLNQWIAANRPQANRPGSPEKETAYLRCEGTPTGFTPPAGFAASCAFVLNTRQRPADVWGPWEPVTNTFAAPLTSIDSQQCYDGYVLDLGTGQCLRTNDVLAAESVPQSADGICPVVLSVDLTGWTKLGGDPDCETTPGLTVAGPTIDLVKPTGEQVRVKLDPPAAPGEKPGVGIERSTPDPASGVTKHEKAKIGQTPGSAGQTIYNVTNNYYSGLGPESNPIINVTPPPALPPVVTITGQSAPVVNVAAPVVNVPAPVVNVNTPERVKIDGEVPAGAETLPTHTEEPGVLELYAPLRARLAELTTLEMPAHAAECPTLAIRWNAWGLDVDAQNRFVCDWLEENEALIAALALAGYAAVALIVLLEA